MFDQVLKLILLILDKLPQIDFKEQAKDRFLRSLVALHSSLLKVSINGQAIVDLMEHYQKTDELKDHALLALIAEQESIIADIYKIVDKHKYVDVLNIKLPFLLPAQVVGEKKARLNQLRIWLEFRATQATVAFGAASGVSKILKRELDAGYRLCPPSEQLLTFSKNNLDKIKNKNEMLRQYLDKNFSADELL